MSFPFLKPYKLFPITCRVKYESTSAFLVSPLALANSLPPHLLHCTLLSRLLHQALYLDQAEQLLASEPLYRAFLYQKHSFHLGLAKASCGAQLKFLTFRKALLQSYTRSSHPTFSLVSCTFSSWLCSICNSIIIQCSLVPTCLPYQPESATGSETLSALLTTCFH